MNRRSFFRRIATAVMASASTIYAPSLLRPADAQTESIVLVADSDFSTDVPEIIQMSLKHAGQEQRKLTEQMLMNQIAFMRGDRTTQTTPDELRRAIHDMVDRIVL